MAVPRHTPYPLPALHAALARTDVAMPIVVLALVHCAIPALAIAVIIIIGRLRRRCIRRGRSIRRHGRISQGWRAGGQRSACWHPVSG